MDRRLTSLGLVWMVLGSLALPQTSLAQPAECLFADANSIAAPQLDWAPIKREIDGLRSAVRANSEDAAARQRMADLAVDLAQRAEELDAAGQEQAARETVDRIEQQLPDTLWRMGYMGRNGSSAALAAQGTLHRFGVLLDQDDQLACDFYRQAMDRDPEHAHATYRSAVCVAEQDPRQSLLLMTRAGELGHPSAAVALGLVCLDSEPRDEACALGWFCRAARQGRPRAAGMAGWMLDEGRNGMQDSASALVLYRYAAEHGDRLAQNNLGKMYETGRQVEMNIDQAARWYLEAAEAGFGPAQVNIGRLYAEGKGVPFDLERSIHWLRAAESQGIQQATEILNWMRNNLLPQESDAPTS